jgi:hypothetical protein
LEFQSYIAVNLRRQRTLPHHQNFRRNLLSTWFRKNGMQGDGQYWHAAYLQVVVSLPSIASLASRKV